MNGNEKPRPKRWLPTWRLGIVFALYLAAVVWLQTAKPFMGDQGSSNVFCFLVAIAAALTYGVWFLFFSGQTWRVRLGALFAAVFVVAGVKTLYRIEMVSGDMVPKLVRKSAGRTVLEAKTVRAADVDLATTTAHDFPQFLGPNRDLRVSGVHLARDWSAPPPELLWRQEIGGGWSGFAVVNGYALTMEQRGDREAVTCYDARTGRLRWSRAAEASYVSVVAGDGPRATPTVHEGRVYTLGAQGHLWALDGATGDVLWQKNLLEEYGMTEEQEIETFPYGRSASPLVAGGLVIVPPGGPPGRAVSLVAYDQETGEKVWEARERQISCSSPNVATLGGVEQVLITNEDTVSGHDLATGKRLWEHPWEGHTNADANVSQAVPVPPDRVFVSKGYGLGASLLELEPNGDGTFDVEPVWYENRVLRTKFTNVAIRDGYVYGLSDGILECVELATGRRMWKGGRYQHGQVLLVGDLLLVLGESGELFLVEATPEKKNHVLASLRVLRGKTWNNFALYGDLLLVRNAREAAAYRLPLAG